MNRDQGYTRQDLIDHTKVVYLYPSIATPYENHKDWDNIESGAIIPARCNSHLDENDPPNTVSATGNCTVVLKDLMADISPDPYHSTDRIIFSLRVRSLYGAAHLTIRGYSYQYTTPPTNSSARNSNLKIPADRRVRFRDIQAVISATGHAGDVQVRLEERFRLQPVMIILSMALIRHKLSARFLSAIRIQVPMLLATRWLTHLLGLIFYRNVSPFERAGD